MTHEVPDPDAPAVPEPAVVFRGSRALGSELSLVLESKAIEHQLVQSEDNWVLAVPPTLVRRAREELDRYSAERDVVRPVPKLAEPFSGAAVGAILYASLLLLTAYCAGVGLFGVDWLAAGALDAGAALEWWRAVTALTLHLNQEHLLGNLLFGMVAGAAASRLLGPGIAWAGIVGAGALANYAEILIAPAAHRAVGASTAVFAALGLLTGLAWRQSLTLRARRWYRWAPLIAGISLLVFFGSGPQSGSEPAPAAHVDVLGHLLGFFFGTVMGWIFARGQPRSRSTSLQIACGAGAMLLVLAAWLIALRHAP